MPLLVETPRISSISAARDRLVVGDDGEHLQGRARQTALLDHFPRHEMGEVRRGAERPALGDAGKAHATIGIELFEFLQQRGKVGVGRQAAAKLILRDRLGRSEKQGLQRAQMLRFGPRRLNFFRLGEEPYDALFSHCSLLAAVPAAAS